MITALLILGACGEPADGPEAAVAPPPETVAVEVPAGDPEPRPERVAARHILVTWTGSEGAAFGTVRTKKEAVRRVGEIQEELAAGVPFPEVARKYSDDPTAGRGGFLGSGEQGTWVPAFEEVVFALPVGGVSGRVETPFGFHIIRRDALEEIRLKHLVVQVEGIRTQQDGDPTTRSAAEAKALAAEALAALDAGEDFASVAARFSDGPMGLRGAELGWFLRGELGPEFDDAAFELEVGGHSAVVETRFGFHVIQRVE